MEFHFKHISWPAPFTDSALYHITHLKSSHDISQGSTLTSFQGSTINLLQTVCMSPMIKIQNIEGSGFRFLGSMCPGRLLVSTLHIMWFCVQSQAKTIHVVHTSYQSNSHLHWKYSWRIKTSSQNKIFYYAKPSGKWFLKFAQFNKCQLTDMHVWEYSYLKVHY